MDDRPDHQQMPRWERSFLRNLTFRIRLSCTVTHVIKFDTPSHICSPPMSLQLSQECRFNPARVETSGTVRFRFRQLRRHPWTNSPLRRRPLPLLHHHLGDHPLGVPFLPLERLFTRPRRQRPLRFIRQRLQCRYPWGSRPPLRQCPMLKRSYWG